MKTAIVLLLIILFMGASYFLNRWLRIAIKPRQSLGKLLLYMLSVLAMVFLLSFLMVLIIAWLYPDELIA
jgi:hypothetical protein